MILTARGKFFDSFIAGDEILRLILGVAKILTVSTTGDAKFRQIVVLWGSLACGRGAQGHMAQMAHDKSGPGFGNSSVQLLFILIRRFGNTVLRRGVHGRYAAEVHGLLCRWTTARSE
jgi:hypothetical protein